MIPQILSDLLDWEAWEASDRQYIWCKKEHLEAWHPTLILCGLIVSKLNLINSSHSDTTYIFIPEPPITGEPRHVKDTRLEMTIVPGHQDKLWNVGGGGRLHYKAIDEHFTRTFGDHYVPEQPNRPQYGCT